jgi:hypothetical protein
VPTIFISYRRDDTAGYAGRLHEHLASIYGSSSVFMDLDDIAPGLDFVSAIDEGIKECDVMLVLIGRRWLDARDASSSRRLDNPADFVRIEIAKGLERRVRMIPVLFDGASMPAGKDLPADLGQLAHIQAISLSEERWDYDTSQLVKAIGGSPAKPAGGYRTIGWMAAALAVLLMLVVAALIHERPASPVVSVAPGPAVSGRWTAELPYDFGTHAERFVFRASDGMVGGTASFLGVERGIVDGRIDGRQLTFATRTEERAGEETRQAEHRYRGVVDGDEIRFQMQTEGGFAPHAPVEFVARRADAAPSTAAPAGSAPASKP